jgi:hypothetical protein
VHTIYIKDPTDTCIATIFAEDGVDITKDDFLQALPETSFAKEAYFDSEYIIRVGFPIFIKKSFSLYVK